MNEQGKFVSDGPWWAWLFAGVACGFCGHAMILGAMSILSGPDWEAMRHKQEEDSVRFEVAEKSGYIEGFRAGIAFVRDHGAAPAALKEVPKE